MSGVSDFYALPSHRTATTWAPFGVGIEINDVPVDLSGARGRLVAKDAVDTLIVDWDTSDPEKPGLALREDPTEGWILWIDGPPPVGGADAVLTLPVGILLYELKTWIDDEIAIDLHGTWAILGGPA
jgi:hypothetical protein